MKKILLSSLVFAGLLLNGYDLNDGIGEEVYLNSVQENGKYGFADENGNIVIKAKYDKVGELEDGLAAVAILNEKESKMGFINTKGEVVIPIKYDNGSEFRNGVALVFLDKKWGAVNRFGDMVLNMEFDDARLEEEIIIAAKDGKYGIYARDGKELIAPKYYMIEEFKESGFAVTWVKTNDKTRHGVIYKNGKEVLPPKFDYNPIFYDDKEQYQLISMDGKYGVINRAYEIVVPIEYEKVDFDISNSGVLIYGKDGKMGLVASADKKTEPKFDMIELDPIKKNVFHVNENGKWGLYGENLEPIVEPKYNEALFFGDHNVSTFKENKKFGVIDINGKIIIPAQYFMIFIHSDGIYAYPKNDNKTKIYFTLDGKPKNLKEQ